jgi:FMN phosphatase YigB (HAD superfamily)
LLIALDLGGVIVDVDHRRTMDRLGIDRPMLERAFFDDGLHDAVTIGAVDGATFTRTAAERLGRDVREVEEAWALVVDVMPAGRALVDDLVRAGVEIVLWTNTDPIHLPRMLAGLPPEARDATASFRLGAMKPEPAFFAKALEHGEPVVFLDDLAKNVAAAKRAGVDARVCLGPIQARAILSEIGALSS